MELKNTIGLMNSSDYKERFKAEYFQTKIRYEKLHKMTTKYEAGVMENDASKYLGFTPTCPLELLLSQKRDMGMYLHDLEIRAHMEGIDLSY